MWSGRLWSLLVAIQLDNFLCNPVSISTPFNDSIRNYSDKDVDINSTARTLQQEDLGRYANFAPLKTPIRFQEDIPDNALSGSAYSRGLSHHDHGGYGLHGFDEGHYGYAYDFDHHGLNHLEDHGHHGHHDHHGHHFGHGLGHGFHHKLYNPALAAKAVLWPLAGLALLGTAAALVSNPVLLQLGVISGRRRRDTQEVTGPDFDPYKWDDGSEIGGDEMKFEGFKRDDSTKVGASGGPKKRVHKDVKGVLFKRAYQIAQSTGQPVTLAAPEYNRHSDDDKFVPVPLKIKRN
ncbi:hypothetical protein O0L34_g13959 [Tuta absoluta]|nr:hypothetical protein O0L34_g13959 [Tuta absoluta]